MKSLKKSNTVSKALESHLVASREHAANNWSKWCVRLHLIVFIDTFNNGIWKQTQLYSIIPDHSQKKAQNLKQNSSTLKFLKIPF